MNTAVPDFSRYCLGTVFFRSNDFLENDFWECSSYFSRGDDICTVLKKFLYFIFNVVLFVNEMVVSRRFYFETNVWEILFPWKSQILERGNFGSESLDIPNFESHFGKPKFRRTEILRCSNFGYCEFWKIRVSRTANFKESKFWEARILEKFWKIPISGNPDFANTEFRESQICCRLGFLKHANFENPEFRRIPNFESPIIFKLRIPKDRNLKIPNFVNFKHTKYSRNTRKILENLVANIDAKKHIPTVRLTSNNSTLRCYKKKDFHWFPNDRFNFHKNRSGVVVQKIRSLNNYGVHFSIIDRAKFARHVGKQRVSWPCVSS